MSFFKITTVLKQSSLIILLTSLCTIAPAYAGSNQNEKPKHAAKDITLFAKQVEKYAAHKGARAFIIARVGRPEKDLPKGIRFTHTAIAVYSSIQLSDGNIARGYAIHNLYQNVGQVDKSTLVIDYPVDFFWGVDELKAGILIPTPELQQRLINTIASGKNKELHNSNYSVIANPFSDQFQNCTEHTLDIVNSSIYQTTNREQLKLNAKAHFKPQRVHTNPLKLMLGSMVMDDVTTKDHKDKVHTATFTTIASYLNENALVSEATVFNQDGKVSQLL